MVETNKLAMVAISKFLMIFSVIQNQNTKCKTSAYNRSHQRRNKHGSDYPAVEFTLRPTDATRIAAIRIHKLEPEKKYYLLRFLKLLFVFFSFV